MQTNVRSRRGTSVPALVTSLAVAAGALACLAWVVPTEPEEDPYVVPDESWVSLTGTVASTATEEFTLDYGEGLVTVEMDDWAWYVDELPLVEGDRVTVYGQVDDDFLEGREIESDSIYVIDRSTYYYPYDVDPHVAAWSFPVVVPPDGTWVSISGKVKKVDGREFMLDTGSGTIQVDTIGMTYNPLDDMGLQKIRPGHRVSVSGVLDLDLFERNEIQADSIVTLSRDKTKQRAQQETS